MIQLADPPLLTLVAQRLGISHAGMGAIMTSGCIAARQAGMLPAAIVVGRWADRFGHKLLLVTGCAVVVLQAVLTLLGNGSYWVIGLQGLGGAGIGLFSALTPLLLADVMEGTGRYNLAQGAVMTLRSLGTATSGLVAEIVVARFSYDTAFLGCAVIAGAALALLWFVMPETRPDLD